MKVGHQKTPSVRLQHSLQPHQSKFSWFRVHKPHIKSNQKNQNQNLTYHGRACGRCFAEFLLAPSCCSTYCVLPSPGPVRRGPGSSRRRCTPPRPGSATTAEWWSRSPPATAPCWPRWAPGTWLYPRGRGGGPSPTSTAGTCCSAHTQQVSAPRRLPCPGISQWPSAGWWRHLHLCSGGERISFSAQAQSDNLF